MVVLQQLANINIYIYQWTERREIKQKKGNIFDLVLVSLTPPLRSVWQGYTCQELKAPAGIALGITRIHKPSLLYAAPSYGRERLCVCAYGWFRFSRKG